MINLCIKGDTTKLDALLDNGDLFVADDESGEHRVRMSSRWRDELNGATIYTAPPHSPQVDPKVIGTLVDGRFCQLVLVGGEWHMLAIGAGSIESDTNRGAGAQVDTLAATFKEWGAERKAEMVARVVEYRQDYAPGELVALDAVNAEVLP